MNTQHLISPVFKQQLRQLLPNVDKFDDRMVQLRHYVAASFGSSKDNEQERLVKAGEIIAKWAEPLAFSGQRWQRANASWQVERVISGRGGTVSCRQAQGHGGRSRRRVQQIGHAQRLHFGGGLWHRGGR